MTAEILGLEQESLFYFTLVILLSADSSPWFNDRFRRQSRATLGRNSPDLDPVQPLTIGSFSWNIPFDRRTGIYSFEADRYCCLK
jgi:hypothetical protein